MAKVKSKKKKRKQTRELIILIILIFISAGLITAMFTLYAQRKKQADQPPVNVPHRPEEAPAEIAELPPETVPETTEPPVDENLVRAEQFMQNMTLEEKIYQMFIITPEELVDNAVTAVVQTGNMSKQALQEKPVGGIVYFAQNMENAAQTTQMITDAQNYVLGLGHAGLWIAVDEEGGTVARVADTLGTTSYESMSAYGAGNDKNAVFMMGMDIAEDISQFGFNLDFAPVADVAINPENELQDRIFSDNPAVVADMVAAEVQGLQNSGAVSATLKHFPGLGAEDGNTHEDTSAYIERTYEELDSVDFAPFRSGIEAGADFIMVGHQTMSCAEDKLPSDLSKTVITEWLREKLNYQGIVITDAHNMNTIIKNYSSGDAALLAIQAGADIVLMPDNLNDAFQTVYDAVENGNLSEERIDESVRRILTAKAKHNLL